MKNLSVATNWVKGLPKVKLEIQKMNNQLLCKYASEFRPRVYHLAPNYTKVKILLLDFLGCCYSLQRLCWKLNRLGGRIVVTDSKKAGQDQKSTTDKKCTILEQST